MDLAEKLLSMYKNQVTNLTLIPSSGGVFEVSLEENLVFSKRELGRFPELREITDEFDNL